MRLDYQILLKLPPQRYWLDPPLYADYTVHGTFFRPQRSCRSMIYPQYPMDSYAIASI